MQALGCVATAAQADDGGHAGVVPAVDLAFVHQLREFAFAGDDVGEVEARELVLLRCRCSQQAALAQAVHQPVVERALVFKLQRTNAVCDLLQRVFDGVGKGVHRVDAPGVARVVVRGAANAVDGWVAQVDVGRGHVNLGAQHGCTIGQLAIAHFAKACKVFSGSSRAERAVDAGLRKVATVDAHFFWRLFVHIGVAGFNQGLGGAVHEIEVVAGLVGLVVARLAPAKAQPLHRVDDAVDVFGVFFFGVGVVKAKVAHATVVTRQTEVDANAFGVAHMQVAVGLWRKTRANLGRVWLALGVMRCVPWAARPAAVGVSALGQIVFDDLAQKVAGLVVLFCRGGGGFRHAVILGGTQA